MFCGDRPNKWLYFLPWVEYAYNISYHSSIEMSSFEALYGFSLPSMVAYEYRSVASLEINRDLQTCDDILITLRQNIAKTQ